MKRLQWISVLLIFALVLAACGGGSQSGGSNGTGGATNNGGQSNQNAAPEEKVKLTLWHHMAGDDLKSRSMRALIEEFQQENPDIELDVQAIPSDGYRPRLKTVAAANEMPDVFIMWPNAMTQEFENAG